MKTITILLSFVVNDHNIVHLADYQTDITDCYQAERMALDQARLDYVDTGKAYAVTVESCVTGVIKDEFDTNSIVLTDPSTSRGIE